MKYTAEDIVKDLERTDLDILEDIKKMLNGKL